jgi:hypothetical protein
MRFFPDLRGGPPGGSGPWMRRGTHQPDCGWILPTPSDTLIIVAHEIAKLMLEHAGTFLERTEAVRVAVSLGMPLREIEEYLDWLDATRDPLDDSSDGESERDD